MIVVAGGSGLLGRLVVGDLVARGEQVRVLVRDTERARTVLGDTVEILAADVRRADGLEQALAQAAVLVSAVHGFLGGRAAGPVEVDQRGNANLVEASRAVGAHVVLVSVIGAAADSALELCRAKHEAERHLRASGASWSIVRAGPFLETWLAVLTQTAGGSGRPVIFGHGDRLLPFVSVTDVAAVVSRAATDPALRGQLLEGAGQPLTMTDLARALQAARGWQGSVRHVPRPVLRALGTLTRPVAPAFARKNRAALAMDSEDLAVSTHTLTPTADLLGRAPLTVADVLDTLSRSGTS